MTTPRLKLFNDKLMLRLFDHRLDAFHFALKTLPWVLVRIALRVKRRAFF
jgi:hypothetical protein